MWSSTEIETNKQMRPCRWEPRSDFRERPLLGSPLGDPSGGVPPLTSELPTK